MLRAATNRPPATTFAEYTPVVEAAVSPGTRRVYSAYWNRVRQQRGERRLDEPSPSEIKQLCEYARAHVVVRRNARGTLGGDPGRHDGLSGDLRRVPLPGQSGRIRYRWTLAAYACEAGAGLGTDGYGEGASVGRDERGTFDPANQLFRYRDRRPITHRRYDHLWHRIGNHLPWVATQQVSTHWLRHTTLTCVERSFGYAVARAYAGHTGRSDAGTTSTYVRADVYEVAQASAVLTGEPHPLAPTKASDRSAYPSC